MSDKFNFEMTTRYKPEFKNLATYERLYEVLAKERRENEGRKVTEDDDFTDDIARMKEIVSGKDRSSIRNKLKNQLHLDIKAYSDISDEEKFNVLKLLHFIVSTNQYEGMNSNSVLKTVSVINLIAKPSLEHTDAENSVYEEHFRGIIEEIRPAVSNADYREETVDWVYSLWDQLHVNLDITMLEDIQMHQNTLQEISQRLKYLLDGLNRDKISQLQRVHEGIIDTFYNMLISSRIIAEIEDMKKVIYDYQEEDIIPQIVTSLSLNDMFSAPVTWKEFQAVTDIKKIDITDQKIHMIWSMILFKENVSAEDLQSINLSDYRFARKYAETIAEYWVKEILKHDTVTLGEWIIVMQELMCIHHDQFKYRNCFIRHTNTDVKLTASIKGFEEASHLPHLIVLKRLTNRMLLTYGTKELFEHKLQADRYIMEIEKIIFSYKNIEDIRTAHSCLYFQVISSLPTKASWADIPEDINQIMQSRLVKDGFPPASLVCEPGTQLLFETMMDILVQDKNFRLTQNDEFMKFRQGVLQVLSDGFAEYITFVSSHTDFSYPEFAYETMANLFAEEIKRIYRNDYSDNLFGSYSQTMTVPICFGEGNEYKLNVVFMLLYQLNVIIISWVGFTGKGIDSYDRYKELLLVREEFAG